MAGTLDGQVAVVTAGAGGAGLVIAKTLAQAGARVAVCDVDPQALAAARADGVIALAAAADVSAAREVEAFFGEVVRSLGPVDLLVNNAGIAGPTAAVEDVSETDWERTLGVNLTAQFLCAKAVIPAMKARKSGLIVNISSTSAKTGLPLRLPYVVSKAGVLSLTSNLARELGPHNIRVNAILPGAIRGARLERVIETKAAALGLTPAEYARELFRYISLRSMVEPEDIAQMIVFLASPAGARISGQHIGVDGNVEWEA
ncbi:MAG: SDR family oxidoreductase [Hyphomicrobiales bacterium]